MVLGKQTTFKVNHPTIPHPSDTMYSQIVSQVNATHTLSTVNIVLVLAKIMEEIEVHGRTMHGYEKKLHSLNIINLMIEKSTLTPQEKETLIQYIGTMGEQIINTIISASNGKLLLRRKWDFRAIMTIVSSVFCTFCTHTPNTTNTSSTADP